MQHRVYLLSRAKRQLFVYHSVMLMYHRIPAPLRDILRILHYRAGSSINIADRHALWNLLREKWESSQNNSDRYQHYFLMQHLLNTMSDCAIKDSIKFCMDYVEHASDKHRAKMITILDDLDGNYIYNLPKASPVTRQIATEIYDEDRWDEIQILGDHLTDENSDQRMIDHIRQSNAHMRGCWVVDHLIGQPWRLHPIKAKSKKEFDAWLKKHELNMEQSTRA